MPAFVKIPNALFSYSKVAKKTVRQIPLKAIDFKVYAYLLSCYRGSAFKAKYSTIAQRVGVKDVKSVQRSIHRLIDLQLITVTATFRLGFQACYQYNVNTLPGTYFKLDKRIFALTLESSLFTVYLCLLMHMDQEGEAFPSTNDIFCETGLSKTTIRRAVKQLQVRGFINKTKRKNKCGDYTKNLFTIIDLKVRQQLINRLRRITSYVILDAFKEHCLMCTSIMALTLCLKTIVFSLQRYGDECLAYLLI